jgi:hypothetical protein
MNETATKRDEIEAERERLAAEAFARIRAGNHWRDWTFIAAGFDVGRQRAMRAAYTNQPMGRGYNTAFAEWMQSRPWARAIDKATRNHLFWVHDHLPEIEQWRETLPASQRDAWNHPTTVKRAFERAMRVQSEREAGKPVLTPTEALKQANAELQAECDRWKRQAEESGSLFDLRRDTPDDIARVVAEHIPTSRAETIARAILAEVKRRKQAHAG